MDIATLIGSVLGFGLILGATALSGRLTAFIDLPSLLIVFGGGLAVLGVASGLFIFTLAGYSTGALVGIYRLSGDVMQVFGPIVIGPVVDNFGFTVSFQLMAGFGLLALLSLALRARK